MSAPPPHTKPIGLTISSLSNQLPARLSVPPFPTPIHRRLILATTDDGLLLKPVSTPPAPESPAVLVRWGVKAKVEPCDSAPASTRDGQDEVEIGGVLGIVRLWDAAYLCVFLPATKQPTRLFPTDGDPFGDPEQRLVHDIYTLTDVHFVPLSKRAPKKQTHKQRWRMPWSPAVGVAPSSDDESSESESDLGSADISQRSSSAVPEADETPIPLPPPPEEDTPEARVKRRMSLGWGRFKPRLGKPRPKSSPAKAAATSAEESPDDKDEGQQMASLPKVTVEPPRDAASERNENRSSTPVGSSTLADVPPSPSLSAASSGSVQPSRPGTPTPEPNIDAPQRRDLETKILRQMQQELGTGEFYYSFEFDSSHTLQYKRHRLSSRTTSTSLLEHLLSEGGAPEKPFFPRSETTPPTSPDARSAKSSTSLAEMGDIVEPDVHLPLWRRFDRRFFWNEHLMRDFIDLGLHAYILPISQGWVQASTFNIPLSPTPADNEAPPPIPVNIALISRRSRQRAGLRYQRRGIDHEGHVANFVETEMMVRALVGGKVSLFSFVQIRGSIPLRWSQSPWSMKPTPVLDQPVDKTFSVANLHFDDLCQRYGPVTIVNLSEQHGREAAVTNGYTELVADLGRSDLHYVPFDFHEHCKGMNWANISDLISQLDFSKMGYLWSFEGDAVQEQQGVFRTNCIDCLDRTNVVQSAIARHVLTQMLLQLGVVVDPTTSNIEPVFNNIWANNGDMISMCYAHTTALKGDFVRTGKRDISGMLNDGVSSLSRMFYGAVTDFFAQAVISFMLGHRNLGVFNEFLENLQTTESSALIKQSRIRAAAIETSSARVLSEGESRAAGWTLLSPEQRNTKVSLQLEEKVLLLTKQALYVVSFNYTLEKVNEFTRIPLKSITSIQKGFVVRFSSADEGTRYSTYSIRVKDMATPAPKRESLPCTPTKLKRSSKSSKVDSPTPIGTPNSAKSPKTPEAVQELSAVDPEADEFFAFKALPREFAARNGVTSDDDDDDDDVGLEAGETCAATVDRIVRRIRDQCARVHTLRDDFVQNKDVVSVADAEKLVSVLERVDYAWKRFLWL
ncbi:hypothetical protein CspeluHIS016_0306140 [Cutaneotrichosporon spelunceum]|uniref:SAC domain-containing protein n=1 Tax=Cutaneotrichosporon spelunceum TaxID=1672016 RepID=A0AAD3TTY4_9TREE|nr:hypothetical protein CspeluHIS016_0306140 [Cutaneotrichosporon spelunceum]